jgi:hypothetical protein
MQYIYLMCLLGLTTCEPEAKIRSESAESFIPEEVRYGFILTPPCDFWSIHVDALESFRDSACFSCSFADHATNECAQLRMVTRLHIMINDHMLLGQSGEVKGSVNFGRKADPILEPAIWYFDPGSRLKKSTFSWLLAAPEATAPHIQSPGINLLDCARAREGQLNARKREGFPSSFTTPSSYFFR